MVFMDSESVSTMILLNCVSVASASSTVPPFGITSHSRIKLDGGIPIAIVTPGYKHHTVEAMSAITRSDLDNAAQPAQFPIIN